MNNFKRIFDGLYHIDLENDEVQLKDTDDGDLDEYIYRLTKEILLEPDNRHFQFASQTTEMYTITKEIYEKEDKVFFNNMIKSAAKRLLRTEKNTREKYGHLTELQKGSLITSLFNYEGNIYVLYSKVEHANFLHADDLIKQIGLPYEKRALKSCLIKFNDEKEIENVIVTDSNGRISTFWWEGFLELEEINTDNKNTSQSFKAIEQLLTKKIKPLSPTDFTILRNNLITYYRTQESFTYESMKKNVFGSYKPEIVDSSAYEQFLSEIEELPEKKKFDRVFNINVDEIKARIRKVFKINDKIDLKIDGEIEDLKRVIRSEKTPDGEKQVIIKTNNEEVFNLFNFKE